MFTAHYCHQILPDKCLRVFLARPWCWCQSVVFAQGPGPGAPSVTSPGQARKSPVARPGEQRRVGPAKQMWAGPGHEPFMFPHIKKRWRGGAENVEWRQGWHILRIKFKKSSPADEIGFNWRKLVKSAENWRKLIFNH